MEMFTFANASKLWERKSGRNKNLSVSICSAEGRQITRISARSGAKGNFGGERVKKWVETRRDARRNNSNTVLYSAVTERKECAARKKRWAVGAAGRTFQFAQFQFEQILRFGLRGENLSTCTWDERRDATRRLWNGFGFRSMSQRNKLKNAESVYSARWEREIFCITSGIRVACHPNWFRD